MHSFSRSWIWRLTLAGGSLFALAAVLLASQTLARSFSLRIYLLANSIFFLDSLDFVLRLCFRRANRAKTARARLIGASVPLEFLERVRRRNLRPNPYAILVSLHNAEDRLDDFLEAMAPYRSRLWAIDDGSTDTTLLRMRQAGFRCLEGRRNRNKPGAVQALLASLPPAIETVLIIDPDIKIRSAPGKELANLEAGIRDFQQSGMAAMCPRITIEPDGLLARFQGLEYAMSFSLGRKSLGDCCITSGIALYRRSVLASALKEHSLSVYAEDLENSVILLAKGERIYYDGRLVVDTEGKGNWRGWFSQRVGWAFGLIRVYLGRSGEIPRIARRRLSAGYQFLVYMGGISLLLQPQRLVAFVLLAASFVGGLDSLFGLNWVPRWTIADPVYFVAAWMKYTLLMFATLFAAVPSRDRTYVLPVVPLYFFYVLSQVIPTTVGYANWFTLGLWGRRLVPDHYQDGKSLEEEHYGVALARGASNAS